MTTQFAALDRQFLDTVLQIRGVLYRVDALRRRTLEKWIAKLQEPQSCPEWKRNRNAYALYLLDQVSRDKLGEPFTKRPPEQHLPTLPAHIRSYYLRVGSDEIAAEATSVKRRATAATGFTGEVGPESRFASRPLTPGPPNASHSASRRDRARRYRSVMVTPARLDSSITDATSRSVRQLIDKIYADGGPAGSSGRSPGRSQGSRRDQASRLSAQSSLARSGGARGTPAASSVLGVPLPPSTAPGAAASASGVVSFANLPAAPPGPAGPGMHGSFVTESSMEPDVFGASGSPGSGINSSARSSHFSRVASQLQAREAVARSLAQQGSGAGGWGAGARPGSSRAFASAAATGAEKLAARVDELQRLLSGSQARCAELEAALASRTAEAERLRGLVAEMTGRDDGFMRELRQIHGATLELVEGALDGLLSSGTEGESAGKAEGTAVGAAGNGRPSPIAPLSAEDEPFAPHALAAPPTPPVASTVAGRPTL